MSQALIQEEHLQFGGKSLSCSKLMREENNKNRGIQSGPHLLVRGSDSMKPGTDSGDEMLGFPFYSGPTKANKAANC